MVKLYLQFIVINDWLSQNVANVTDCSVHMPQPHVTKHNFRTGRLIG